MDGRATSGVEEVAGGVMGASGSASVMLLALLRHCAPSSRAVPGVALDVVGFDVRSAVHRSQFSSFISRQLCCKLAAASHADVVPERRFKEW